MSDHDMIRRDLGVYVLGALDPAERDGFEEHLSTCANCRDEVASLAVLPSLLHRLDADAADVAVPPVGAVIERLASHRRRARVRTRLVALAAAFAVLVAGATVVLGGGSSDPAGLAYADEETGVVATVEERAWGMVVRIEAQQLPPRRGYTAVAVADDGHRAQVASWSNTGRPVKVDGACYMTPDDLERVEIVAGGDEEVVSVLRPSAPPR